MRLSKLEMIGFKSFMSKAELNFERGITAVLGPNGCGKSNIVDAIRWVLGEQSPKLLRGIKMENVIFDGTKRRSPMGFAEVTLTFTGASERLPVEWDEISIKRRVTRAGGSEYFLNNQPYRLHEIKDLLSGTGLGNHVYSIIELGMVKDILAESGEKRRILFEEASGIMRYKTRRKESLSKLSSTEADLTRLDDILDELGKSVRSLKYQVGRARSYQRIQEQLRAAELRFAAEQLHGYWREERELQRRLRDLGDSSRASEGKLAGVEAEESELGASLLERDAAYTARWNELETETNAYRKREEELAVLEERIRSEERRIGQLEQEGRLAAEGIGRLEGEQSELAIERESLEELLGTQDADLSEAEERHREAAARFEERRQRLTQEKQLQLDFARHKAEAGGEVERLRERLEQSAARRAELDAEDGGLRARREELATRLVGLREREAAAAAALLALQNRETELRERRERAESGRDEVRQLLGDLELRQESQSARLELLERLRDEGAGYSEGTRRLLERHQGDAALRGTLADSLRVEERHRPAVECALERLLGALVTGDRSKGLSWLGELRAEDGGRALLLEAAGGRPLTPESLPGLTPLVELLDCDAELRAPLSRLLARHYLAPDAEAARVALARQGGEDLTLVTPDGFLFQSGLVSGGSTGAEEARPLGRAAEIAALGERIAALKPERERLETARADHERTLAELREADAELVSALVAARRELGERETERARQETLLGRCEEELTTVGDELALQGRQAEALVEALQVAEGSLSQVGEQDPDESVDLEALEIEVARLERERDTARGVLDERRLERTAARGRRENLALRAENLERAMAGQWSRRRGAEEGVEEARRQMSEHRERSGALREELAGDQERLQGLREGAEALRAEVALLRERQGELQAQARKLREHQRESEQAGHELEIKLNTLGVKMTDMRERVRGELGRELDPAVDPAADPDEDAFEPPEGQSLGEAVGELKDKLARIGAVNLLALEEFEEKDERYQFLQAQKHDLVTAREQLLETIKKINQEARQRFSESFKVIRENFIEIFLTLFDGGEADLSFSVREDDPLQADIVVTAKPKEKNISSVQLLSSGEKTLTALSLLFAVYLSRPSPFCVFDEVDAPLDDANIGRFTKLVREFTDRTQFVIITHNKRTMEVASHLYGVTMEESGVSKLVSVAFEDVPEEFTSDGGDEQAEARSAS